MVRLATALLTGTLFGLGLAISQMIDPAKVLGFLKKAEGNTDFVRLLFGCIAAVFFFLVLFQDVLGVVDF